MGEYERMVLDYVLIVSAPSIAPHLVVVTLALLGIALAVVAAVIAITTARWMPAAVIRDHRTAQLVRVAIARAVGTDARARAPSSRMLPSRA